MTNCQHVGVDRTGYRYIACEREATFTVDYRMGAEPESVCSKHVGHARKLNKTHGLWTIKRIETK